VWPRKEHREGHHQTTEPAEPAEPRTLRPARSNRVILSPFPGPLPSNPTTSLPATRAFNSSHRPKPRRPIPQERAPRNPPSDVVLTSQEAHLVAEPWSGLFPFLVPYILYLVWPDVFALRHPYPIFSFLFRFRFTAAFLEVLLFAFCVPLTWFSSRSPSIATIYLDFSFSTSPSSSPCGSCRQQDRFRIFSVFRPHFLPPLVLDSLKLPPGTYKKFLSRAQLLDAQSRRRAVTCLEDQQPRR
jgi:hypothetical protein